MSEINYQALREVAERAIPAMERLLMLPVDDDLLSEQELKDYGVDIDALNAFKFLTGPETVLALLDERERNQQYIKHRDQENEDIALTVGRLRVEMEAAEKRTAELESLAAPQLPQPAVVVSEAQSKKLFDEWSGGDGALGELRASGVPDEFISMLKEFSLATWEACREAMIKHSAPFIVTSDHRMMEMPAIHDIDAVAAMLQGADGNSPVIAKAYDIEAFGVFSATEGKNGLLLQIEQFWFGTENCPQIGKENMVPKFALQAIINRLQAHCNSMGEDTLIDIFASSAAPQQEDK